MTVLITRLTETAIIPQRMSEHASGFDLYSDLAQAITLNPRQRYAVPTGIAMEIPCGFEAQVRPRSGLALKLGLGILNSPGTIDADYRGELKVILINLSDEQIIIEPGMRIAQLVFSPVLIPELVRVENLTTSIRQDGGFGHTGLN
jgi:dUTP pyrophosphatase